MSVSQSAAIAANSRLVKTALVESNVREDGRTTRESRSVGVTFLNGKVASTNPLESDQVTTCFASLGRTRCAATLSACIAEPALDRANEGQLAVFVDCERDVVATSGGSVSGTMINELSRYLDLLLKHSRAVDLESLCIIPARQAWSLRLDVRVLELDGNLLDACCVAAVGAAKAFKRPGYQLRDGEASGSSEKAKIVPLDEREGIRLTVHHTPFAVSFVAFRVPPHPHPSEDREEGGEDLEGDEDEDAAAGPNFIYAIDPTLAEEAIADAKVTVAADAEGCIRLVRKPGGCALPKGDLTLLARLACIRARELAMHVDKVCKAFEVQEKQERIRRKAGAASRGGGAGHPQLHTRQFSRAAMTMPDFDRSVQVVDMDEEALGLVDEVSPESEAPPSEGGGPGSFSLAMAIDGQQETASCVAATSAGKVKIGHKSRKLEAKAGGEGGDDDDDTKMASSPNHLSEAFNPSFLKKIAKG